MTDIGGLLAILRDQQRLKAEKVIEDRSASFSSGASNDYPLKRQTVSESPRIDSESRSAEHRVGRHAHIKNSQAEEKHGLPLADVLPCLKSAQRWTCIRQIITTLLFLRSQDVAPGNICVESVVALRDTDADVDPDEEEHEGSEWIFKLLLPSEGTTGDMDFARSSRMPLVGIAPVSSHLEPNLDSSSVLEDDSRAFGELALEILGDEIHSVEEFVELPHDHPQALAIIQCSLLAGRKVRLPTVDHKDKTLSHVDPVSPEGKLAKLSKQVSFHMDHHSDEHPLAHSEMAVKTPSRKEAQRLFALLEEKCVRVLCSIAVENIYGVEGVCSILEKHATRTKVHRCLLNASQSSVGVNSMVSEMEAALRQDPFVGHAHVALSLGAWQGRSTYPKPRTEVASLLQGGQGSPAVDAEVMSSLLRGGWLAEAWNFATSTLRAWDAFDADWPRLLAMFSSEEAERVETLGLCQSQRALVALLPSTRRACKPVHRQLRRTLERLRSVALEKLSLLPLWPLLLPPHMARDAAKVAYQQAAFTQIPTSQFVLWHLASTLPLVGSLQDAVTHLLCSWPQGCGVLGVHLVQPSGIVLWATTDQGSQVLNTASAATQSPSTSGTIPNVGQSQFTSQIGLTLAALLTQQRLMVFLNYCGVQQGWETHILRCVGMQSGVMHSALIPGNPQVLILMRTDKTLERFVLQPQANSLSRPTSSLRSDSRSPPRLSGLLSGSRSPKPGKEGVVMSSAATMESLIASLHLRSLRNAEFEVLSIICASDGSQLLLPLRMGPSDLRLLVVLHSLPHEGDAATMPEGSHFQAQQLHGFSMAKLPTQAAQHVPINGSVQEASPGPSEARKESKMRKQTTFATAAAMAASQMHQHQDTIGKQRESTGLRGAFQKVITGSVIAGISGRPAPVLPANAAFFFLPHIWEVLLCLETQLLWWKLPYPLSERAAAVTTDGESMLRGMDDFINHGTQVHYLCELPFSAWSWQLILGKTRLVAFVGMHSNDGAPLHGKRWNRRPDYIAIIDAWYGDVMRMISLPSMLFNVIPARASFASAGSAEELSPIGNSGPALHCPPALPTETQPACESAGTVHANDDWQPPYRLATSNNVVVVSVSGRAAFWPAAELVQSKETNDSTRQKIKHALRRLSILNRLVVQDHVMGPVGIEHNIISSGGRDGLVRPAPPGTSSVEPTAVQDTPCLDWQEYLFLADVAFWSTGGSLHALFHSMVGYNAAGAPVSRNEAWRLPGQTSFDDELDIAPPPWADSPVAPDLGAAMRSRSATSSPGVQQVGAIPAKGADLTSTQQGQHRRETGKLSETSRSPSISRLTFLKSSLSASTPASSRGSATASPRGSSSASGTDEAESPVKPYSDANSSTGSILRPLFSSKNTGKERRPTGKAPENDAAVRPQTLAQDLLTLAAAEPLPTATWLVEAWVVVNRVLSELQTHLFPLVMQALPVLTALIEACGRVAAPIRPVLHDRLQEICEGVTDSTGHTGPQAWGTKICTDSTVASFMENIYESGSGMMVGRLSQPSTPKQQEIVTVFEGTKIEANLQSAILLGCGDAGGRVASIAMDAHGCRLLVAREGDRASGHAERWVIEFWQVEDQGRWTRRQAQQQRGQVHALASPPICALSDGAVIGFTASESLYAWDCEDGELLFHLDWDDNMPAFGLWSSGDASRISVATSNAVYLWKDAELVQTMDCRAIVILAEQGHMRSIGSSGQPGFSQRQLTAAHCSLSSDGESTLAAIVDCRWLAVFSLQPRKEARVAYVMSHAAADLLGLWVSTSGVFLLLLPGKLEVWMLPLKTAKHGCRSHHRVLHRANTGHRLKETPKNEGEVLHGAFEETFENLTGGVPEVLVGLSAPPSRRLCQSTLTLLQCKHIVTFNERSRLLICWDAEASAAVGFLLPTPLKTTAILTPHWATLLPAMGSLRITGACSCRGDTVVLSGGRQWYLWTFEISVTRALLRASKLGSVDEDSKISTLAKERSSSKKDKKRNTISARLAEAEQIGKSRRVRKRNARVTTTLAGDIDAMFTMRIAPDLQVRPQGKDHRTIAQPQFPLLPASPGICLRPASWWLEKNIGSSVDAGATAQVTEPGCAQREITSCRAKLSSAEKENQSKKRPKSAETKAKPTEPSTEISEKSGRKVMVEEPVLVEESPKSHGWSLLRRMQSMESDQPDERKEEPKTTINAESDAPRSGWRETGRMHVVRTPPLSCTRAERSKPNQQIHALPSSKHSELHVGTGPQRQPAQIPSRPRSRCTPEPPRARSVCTPEHIRVASALGRLSITPSSMPDVDLESCALHSSHSTACRPTSPAVDVKSWCQRISQQSISENDRRNLCGLRTTLGDVESRVEPRAASREAQRRVDRCLMLGVSVLAKTESDVQDVAQMEGKEFFNWEIPLVSPAAPPALAQPRLKTQALGSRVKFWPKGTKV